MAAKTIETTLDVSGSTSVVAKGVGGRKKKISLEKKKARHGWLFVLPFVLGFVLIYLPIIFDSVKLSFFSIKSTSSGVKTEFIGLENYKEALFGEYGIDYIQALGDGLLKLILDIPTIIVFSLFIAVLLNQKIIGRAAFRAIFFMPVILSTGIMAHIDMMNVSSMDDPTGSIDTGAQQSGAAEIVNAMDVSALFSNMAVGSDLAQTVANAVNNIYDIVNRSGVQMLIFLAGLQSISPAIYESCDVEGATAWETFWKITFPMISPMILVNLVYTIIDSFTDQSNPVMGVIDEVYSQARTVSSAMAWIYFLIVMLIIGACAGIASAFTFYQRRDK